MTTSGGGGSRSPTSQLHAGAAAAQTVAARLLQPIDRRRGEAEVASRGDLLMCFIIVGVTVQLRVDDETFNASARTTPAPPAEAATPVLAASIAAACYIEEDDKMSSGRVSRARSRSTRDGRLDVPRGYKYTLPSSSTSIGTCTLSRFLTCHYLYWLSASARCSAVSSRGGTEK